VSGVSVSVSVSKGVRSPERWIEAPWEPFVKMKTSVDTCFPLTLLLAGSRLADFPRNAY